MSPGGTYLSSPCMGVPTSPPPPSLTLIHGRLTREALWLHRNVLTYAIHTLSNQLSLRSPKEKDSRKSKL